MIQGMRLDGPLDRNAFVRAIQAIVARHESLRTHFVEMSGTPAQVIKPEMQLVIPTEDLRGFPEDEQEKRIADSLEHERETPFDLGKGPVLRARLFHLGEAKHVFLLTVHHIAFDGWSDRVFNEELGVLYAAFREGRDNPLKPLTVQYADFALWQRQSLNDDALEVDLAYWKQQLAGAPERLELPTDRSHSARAFKASMCSVVIGAEVVCGLRRLCRAHQTTFYTALLAAFGVLLSRYSGQQDIVVGSPAANRQDSKLAQLIGFFVNSLAMRLSVHPQRSFIDLLSSVRRTTLDAHAHQDVPFERVVEALAPRRSVETAPLFQVTFSRQTRPWTPPKLPQIDVSRFAVDTDQLRFELKMHVREEHNELVVLLRYNADLFDEWRIEQMARHFGRVLASVSADPTQLVGSVPLLSPTEQHEILSCSNALHETAPNDSVLVLVEAQAARVPDAVAVRHGDHSVSFETLDRLATRMAYSLRALGARPECCVGVALERSPAQPITILAVWKARAAYLPLDRTHPVSRLATIVDDAEPLVVVSDKAAPEPWSAGLTIIRPADAWKTIATADHCSNSSRECRLHCDGASYILYTSGSTGVPKGVVATHRSLAHVTLHIVKSWGLRPDDVVAALAPSGVDFSLLELLAPLTAGASARLVSPHDVLDAASVNDALRDVTVCHAVSRLMYEITSTAAAAYRTFPRLRRLSTGGDVIPAGVPEGMRRVCPRAAVEVNYGPTETTVICADETFTEDSFGRAAALGRPISGTRLYVLDGRMAPVPIGVIGELYIAGIGVSRGYLKRPALTAERFISDPFGPSGTRMYRTGDCGTWRPDGTLTFAGRMDHQVKIRGFRVELGEIEAALRGQSGIRDAVVTSFEEVPGDRRLAAYIIASANASGNIDRVRERLRDIVPEYMVPSTFTVLDRLPLTSSGKVDRAALPSPAATPNDGLRRSPRTPEEQVLCGLWQEVLNNPYVGIDDNFFALGGHSLLATRLVSRIRATFGVDIAIATLFDAPRVIDFAPSVRSARPAHMPLVAQPRPTPLPASFAQQRLWFLDRLAGGATPEFNVSRALRLRGPLNQQALRHAINTIVARHESLRTHFEDTGDAPAQLIVPHLEVPIAVVDLRGLADRVQLDRIQEHLCRERELPFDLGHGPVIRANLLQCGAEDHVLLWTMHHIVSDGWSQGIFNRELSVLYDAYSQGRDNPLPPLPVQYADFTLWQRQWLDGGTLEAGLAYWKDQLAGMPARLELPTDRPRSTSMSFSAERVEVVLAPEPLTVLKRVSQEHHATMYMTLLAAFGVLLARYSGQSDIVVGSPIANRKDTKLENLIGFFVNPLVLRMRIRPEQPFAELLAAVRRTMLEAYQHQDVPFERLVEALLPTRSTGSSPLFQVVLDVLNMPLAPPQLSGVEVERIETGTGHLGFDLQVHAYEYRDALAISWRYNPGLFDKWRIEQMAQHYERVLSATTDDPHQAVGRIALLNDADRAELLQL